MPNCAYILIKVIVHMLKILKTSLNYLYHFFSLCNFILFTRFLYILFQFPILHVTERFNRVTDFLFISLSSFRTCFNRMLCRIPYCLILNLLYIVRLKLLFRIFKVVNMGSIDLLGMFTSLIELQTFTLLLPGQI